MSAGNNMDHVRANARASVSRNIAANHFGARVVANAEKWLDQELKSRGSKVEAILRTVVQSHHPYAVLVAEYQARNKMKRNPANARNNLSRAIS